MQYLKEWVRDRVPRVTQVPAKYWYERCIGIIEPEVALLADLVRPGQLALDVGANRGVYSYALWRIGARVHAFEPNPACYEILKAWADRKGRAQIHAIAASNGSGSADLIIPVDRNGVWHDSSGALGKACPSGRAIRVRTSRLDDIALGDVAFVKIDVEGHESAVLRGAEQLLATCRPAILAEIEQRHHAGSIMEIFEWMEARGYRSCFLKDGLLRGLVEFDASQDQVWSGPNRYINNFLFLHRERLNAGDYGAFLSKWAKPL